MMTADATPAPIPTVTAARTRRPFDVLGLIGLILGGLVFLPSLLVFLIGLIPEMNPIWWLGIILLPLLGIAGLLALVLGLAGILVARRRGGRSVLSVIALVLGVLMVIPPALIFLPSMIQG